MNLSTRLQLTSKALIDKYGSDVVLKFKNQTGTYIPSQGGYVIVEQTFNDTAVFSKISNDELMVSGIDNGMWSNVSGVAIIAYNANYVAINNQWTINDRQIFGIKKTEIQNEEIVMKVYF